MSGFTKHWTWIVWVKVSVLLTLSVTLPASTFCSLSQALIWPSAGTKSFWDRFHRMWWTLLLWNDPVSVSPGHIVALSQVKHWLFLDPTACKFLSDTLHNFEPWEKVTEGPYQVCGLLPSNNFAGLRKITCLPNLRSKMYGVPDGGQDDRSFGLPYVRSL